MTVRLKYTAEDPRTYPTLRIDAQPGQVYDLDADPGDGRWTAESADPAPAPAPVAPAEPAPTPPAEPAPAAPAETTGA